MYKTELSFTSTSLFDDDIIAPIIPMKMRNSRNEAIIKPRIEANRYFKKVVMVDWIC